MDARKLQKKLGIAPGATLKALVDLAERVSPSAPWDAFAPLWLKLPWLEKGVDAASMRHATPSNVHPFAETGGNLNHFGFLLDGDGPTDERPIVYVVPTDEPDATEIVAPNLRAFLGLVAVAFGEVVSRSATDAEWRAFRRDWYGDDTARLAEMERLSTLLGSLPGVVRPTSPSSVANAVPNQAFELAEVVVAPDAQREELTERVEAARDRLLALSDGMVDGRTLDRASLLREKQEATDSLVALLDAMEALERGAAGVAVAGWRDEPMLWKALTKGAAGDLAEQLARYDAPSDGDRDALVWISHYAKRPRRLANGAECAPGKSATSAGPSPRFSCS